METVHYYIVFLLRTATTTLRFTDFYYFNLCILLLLLFTLLSLQRNSEYFPTQPITRIILNLRKHSIFFCFSGQLRSLINVTSVLLYCAFVPNCKNNDNFYDFYYSFDLFNNFCYFNLHCTTKKVLWHSLSQEVFLKGLDRGLHGCETRVWLEEWFRIF